MNRQTKKILLISVAALLVIALVAGLIVMLRKDANGDNAFTRDKAIATVNGAKITRGEFASSLSNYYNNLSTYNMYALYYGYGTYYDVSTEDGMMSLKNDILSGLIDNEVYIQMAKDLGVTLTDEELSAAEQAGKDALANLKEQILESAKSSGAQNPETYADTMLANYLSQMGISQKTFVARNQHAALADAYAEKLQDYLYAQRNVTEDELKDIYDKFAQTYVDTYTDGVYAQQASYVALGYSDLPYLYIPEDFLFVQVIETSDAEKAQTLLEQGKSGDFEALMTGEDNENEITKTLSAGKGLAIGEKDSPFDAAVYALAKDMSVGDVDMAQASSTDSEGKETTTYFIVKRVEGTTGLIPYEEVKDVIDSVLTDYAESTYYTEQVNAWKEKAAIDIDEAALKAYDPAA